MWPELSFAFCAGCWLHALLAKIGIFKNDVMSAIILILLSVRLI